MKIPAFHKLVAVLMASLIFFITFDSGAQSPPPPPPDPDDWVALLCVAAFAGIIIGVGSCAGKKLLNKPPRTFPDEDEPPQPPTSTNSPPVTKSLPRLAAVVISAGADNPECGMVKWDIQESNKWLTDTNSYRNTTTGSRYTHIITASIQGSTNMQDWSVVGSRMIWWSDQDQTALINYYDPAGAVILTRYVPRSEVGEAPIDSDSKVPLEDWEMGDQPARFYRLASPSNHIGVLTRAITGNGE